MKKRRTKDGIMTEAAHQLAEAAVGAGVRSRTFGYNDFDDGTSVKITVEVYSKEQRYEAQKGEGIDGIRITDTSTDSRVATCYDPANATLVLHALNAMAKRTP